MHEAFLIQFGISRQAHGHNPAPEPQRPANHPPTYETFEHKLPLQMAITGQSIVVWDPLHLVQPPKLNMDRAGREHTIKCGLCVKPFTSKHIYRFWSHMKYRHTDVDEHLRLQAVKAETAGYLAWIARRKTGRTYLATDPARWNRMQQTQLEDFDWFTFMSWKLPSDSGLSPGAEGDPLMY